MPISQANVLILSLLFFGGKGIVCYINKDLVFELCNLALPSHILASATQFN